MKWHHLALYAGAICKMVAITITYYGISASAGYFFREDNPLGLVGATLLSAVQFATLGTVLLWRGLPNGCYVIAAILLDVPCGYDAARDIFVFGVHAY